MISPFHHLLAICLLPGHHLWRHSTVFAVRRQKSKESNSVSRPSVYRVVDGRHHAQTTCWDHDLTLHTIPLRNNLAPLGILPRLMREGGSCTPLTPFRLGSGASVTIKFHQEYTIKCTCRPEAHCRHGFPTDGILRWARTDAAGKPSVLTPSGRPALMMMSQGSPYF